MNYELSMINFELSVELFTKKSLDVVKFCKLINLSLPLWAVLK